MIYLLTSSPLDDEGLSVRTEFGFLERLKTLVQPDYRALFICSDPDSWEMTDYFAEEMRKAFAKSGLTFQDFWILDGRNQAQASDLVARAEVIFLAGGHVPTQNQFFQAINLRELLSDRDKLIIGTSAGSMNAATIVYSQPEETGEALSKTYQRFLEGLRLTDKMLIPHYQDIKDQYLDGLAIIEEITLPDSQGREFYLLEDGAYLLGDGKNEKFYGPTYRAKDGYLTKLENEV